MHLRNAILGLLLAGVMLIVTSPASAAWNQYRGDAARTASATWPSETGPAGSVAWRSIIGQDAMIDASPVVNPNSGVIYVGTTANSDLGGGSRLLAFYPNGALQWRASLEGFDVRAAPAIRRDSHIAVVGTRAFQVRDNRTDGLGTYWDFRERAFLLDPFRGGVRAKTDQWEPTFRTSPVVDERANKTYVQRPNGLSALDWQFTPLDTLKVWVGVNQDTAAAWKKFLCPFCIEFDTSGSAGPPRGPEPPIYPRLPSPALSTTCEDVVWGFPFGNVVRAPLNTGRGRFQPAALQTTAALGRAGRMYAVRKTSAGYIYVEALSAAGSSVWKTGSLGRGTPSPPALGRGLETNRHYLATCEGVRDRAKFEVRDRRQDTIYLTVGDRLMAIDDQGVLRWSVRPGASQLGEPVVVRLRDGRELIVVTTGGTTPRVVAYRSTGSVAWQVSLDRPALGSPAVANGRIYVATTMTLYAIQ